MSNWRYGNNQDDQKTLLSSENPGNGNHDVAPPADNNPISNFPSSNYSDPSQPGHYSSPIQNTQYPPVDSNISANPPQYEHKAADPNSPNFPGNKRFFIKCLVRYYNQTSRPQK